MSEKQSEFEAMENELAKAKEATQQANAKATELENVANEAKDAETERSKLQAALDQANKEIERLKMSLSNRSQPHLSRASQSHRRQEKEATRVAGNPIKPEKMAEATKPKAKKV